MKGLYLVGTPIGNLSDISSRALETLGLVDFIAAEDTRVSLKLLNRFGIKKPVISYHAHNMRERGEEIARRIIAGEACALITDAGMPCISDPGEGLVRICAERCIPVVVIPGPSAALAALAASGLSAGRFSFEGFLSVKRSSRFSHLLEISKDTRTLIFYEAPHKLKGTLQDMLEVLGNRRVVLARELTKLHEEVIRTTLSEAAGLYNERAPRGEFVLVVEGAKKEKPAQASLEEAAKAARELMLEEGMGASQAAREAARATGHKKSELYRALMKEA